MSTTTKAKATVKKSTPRRVVKKQKYTDKSYRLTDDRTGLAFILKTGKKRNLLILDEDHGIKRPIRHCPSEPTIYADSLDDIKQAENALVVPIIFLGGYLLVKGEDVITQRFLDAHPDNMENGGRLFELVNDEKEAENDVDLDELKMDIYNAVRDKSREDGGEYALEALVAVLEGSVEATSEMGVKSLKRRIYQEIENDPNYFTDDNGNVNIFEDDYISRKYFVLRAIKEQIIRKSNNNKSIVWAKDSSLIMTAPRGVELTEAFTDFLSSDEGLLVAEEIKRRL